MASVVAAFLVVYVVEVTGSKTDCGGTPAAFHACQLYAGTAYLQAQGDPRQIFNPRHLAADDLGLTAVLPGNAWVGSARFLVRKGDMVMSKNGSPRTIVVVSNRGFNNVHGWGLLPAPFTYAVGYSNGEAGLISEEEFSRLDFTQFVDAATIIQ